MLSYLAGCARSGTVIEAIMPIKDRHMRFTEVMLRSNVIMAAGADLARARLMREVARDKRFTANSVRFPMRHEATIVR
jgi:hypothetical protein